MSSTLLVLVDTRLSRYGRLHKILHIVSWSYDDSSLSTIFRPRYQPAPIILPLLRSILFSLIDFKGLLVVLLNLLLSHFAFRIFSRIPDKSFLSLDPTTTFPSSSSPTRHRARFVKLTTTLKRRSCRLNEDARKVLGVQSRGHLNRIKRLSLSVSRITN